VPKPKAKTPAAKPAKGSGPPGALPPRTRFQKYEQGEIARSQLTEANYNANRMDPHRHRRLGEVLKKHGLVEAITWNRRTGNLVNGHHRIDRIDAMEKGKDYSIGVNIVDVDLETEVRLSLVLNNRALHGQASPDRLVALAPDGEERHFFGEVGYTPIDTENIFLGTEHESIFIVESEVRPAIEALGEAAELARLANGEAVRDPEALERHKKKHKALRDKMTARDARNDDRHILTIVCMDRAAKQKLCARLSLPKASTMVDEDVILDLLDRVEGASE